MMNNRNEVKKILRMDVTDARKKELISRIESTETDVTRIILSNELLDWEEGDIVSNLGNSWSDVNDDNVRRGGYQPEASLNFGDIEYVLCVDNIKGYKIQYFGEFSYDLDIVDKMEEDEVYNEMCDMLGTDRDMFEESEILISNNKKFEITRISDERDEVGCITVDLREVE